MRSPSAAGHDAGADGACGEVIVPCGGHRQNATSWSPSRRAAALRHDPHGSSHPSAPAARYLHPHFLRRLGLRQAVGGGGAVVMNGIKRAFSPTGRFRFSPLRRCCRQCDDPVKMGAVEALGVSIDTIVICSCTAFVMLLAPRGVTGGLPEHEPSAGGVRVPSGQFRRRLHHAVTLALFQLLCFIRHPLHARCNTWPISSATAGSQPDGLQSAGAGDAGRRRYAGLHRGVGPRRRGHPA